MITLFKLRGSIWDDIDLPLSYKFNYYNSIIDDYIALSKISVNPSLDTVLQSGRDDDSNLLVLSLNVYDALLSFKTLNESVVVKPLLKNETEVYLMADQASKSENPTIIRNTALYVATSILVADCSKAPSCLHLNRFNCSSTANTCGKCLDGFLGSNEDLNTPCLSSDKYLPIYLNNVKKAGTEFKYQGIKTECKKGLTLIWPSAFTHTHRGIINKKNEKYIITGWYSYI
jgi:hypothetical protein